MEASPTPFREGISSCAAILAFSHSAQRRALRALAFTVAAFALIAAAGAQTASACVTQPFTPAPLTNNFEGADGDQCDSDGAGPKRDWQNVVGEEGFVGTDDDPSDADTIYGSNNAGLVAGGTDETKPDSWNFTIGNLGGSKFDALSAFSFTDPISDKLFVDLGFVRATATGATFLAFELNQRQPGYRIDANEVVPSEPFAVPTRTSGDLLVTYDVNNAGAITLGLCVWDGDEHAGRWEEFAADLSGDVITNQPCPALSNTLYQAALNDALSGRQGTIPAAENHLTTGDIGQGRFGEAVVNLTDALRDPANPTGPQSCIDFGYVWMHSRSSDSLTSAQQDFILPTDAVSIGNCSVDGMKFNDLDGQGDKDAGEPGLAGWTIFVDYDEDGVLDNDKDATFVNDMDGVIEAGEEEPYAVTADGTGPEPLGYYRITDVQRTAAGETWQVREVLQAAWDCTAALGAGAVAGCPEDTSTNPDSALGFQLGWENNDIHEDRDFGNHRQPATLKVVKHVVNDNGGTATAANWSLHVKDGGTEVTGSPQAGDENGDVYTLTDGESYDVSETGGPAGYAATFSGDCDSSGSVTVAAGVQRTCTITNDDVAPTVKVVKHVVNDNGGTATAANWQLHLKSGANDVTGSPQPGDENGDTYTVAVGAYKVSETGGPSGYAATFSGDCDADGDITVTVGQSKTCTITNDDVAPTVKVVKHVVNDNGGTAVAANWQLHLKSGANDVTGSPQAGDENGDTYTVSAGAFTVSETGGPSGYAATFSGDCDADGDITVTVGQDKTCTITNDDVAPGLTVIKHVVNDHGGTATASNWSLHVKNGANAEVTNSPQPGDENGDTYTVAAGSYTVSETGGPSGYAATFSGDCDSNGNVTVTVGQARTCTITNDDVAPTVKVVKHVVNDNGGTATAANWQLHLKSGAGDVTGSPQAGDENGDTYSVSAGSYSVSETGGPSGYAATFSGDCDADGDITVTVGQSKTCTITNDDVAPTVKVVKHVVNDNGGTAVAANWQLHLKSGANDVTGSPQAGDENGDTYTVSAGAFTVSETGGPSGYGATFSGDCDADGDISVTVGQEKTCTITNNDVAPRLTVIKHVVNKGGSTTVASAFQMDVTATNPSNAHFPGSETGTTITLGAGQYSVDESGGPTTFAKSLSADCTGTIAVGQEKTCTITNTKVLPGGVVVKKGPAWAYHGDTLNFTFEVTNPGTTPLTTVNVSDDKCAPVVGPTQKLGGDQDANLDAGETWVYTCTMQVPAHTAGDTTLVNTVTLAATDADGEPVGDTDQHTTLILHPAIHVDKTGPATAQAGQAVAYTIVVTNPGDVPFLAQNVGVQDALCQAPPALTTKNGDATPGQFDPGDKWTYTCTVQTIVGQTVVNNVAVATATDSFGGHTVTDDDPATTQLTQPPVAVVPASVPIVPSSAPVVATGTARLSGPSRCVSGSFTAAVRGRNISRVLFMLDGKRVKTVRTRPGRTLFGVRINPRRQSYKAHRVVARVTFLASANTPSRTLRFVYVRCARVTPKFTG